MRKIKTFLINSQQPGYVLSVFFNFDLSQPDCSFITLPASLVQTVDGAIRCINYYPLDNSIGFASVYPLDSDLSGGYWRQENSSYEKLNPGPEWSKFFHILTSEDIGEVISRL